MDIIKIIQSIAKENQKYPLIAISLKVLELTNSHDKNFDSLQFFSHNFYLLTKNRDKKDYQAKFAFYLSLYSNSPGNYQQIEKELSILTGV